VGCDFAGVVEEVGPRVKKEWRKGDRIAAFVHGCNAVEPEDGCFAGTGFPIAKPPRFFFFIVFFITADSTGIKNTRLRRGISR
jgi:hypothetical protein